MKLQTVKLYFGLGCLFALIFSTPMLLQPLIEEPANNTITVMSFNLHQYYVQDPSDLFLKTGLHTFAKVRDLIRNVGADIVGLQESEGDRLSSGNQNGIHWLAEQLDMYYYYGPPTSAQIYGDAILSRWPIIVQEWKQLPTPEGIERAIIRVIIDSPFGEIKVFNTHFEIDRFKEAQRQQANFVVDYVGDQKAMILGDFNTRADLNDEAYHILNNSFTYGLIEAGFHPNSTIGFTAPAANPTHKIDYIWLTPGDWNVVPNSYRAVGDPLTSDHRAVVIDIRMG
ncbi:MAG: hypothetical protein D6732_26195 [Methanobacteriota archaeon]|nr:MAG: hypothetical protein D6732_26195 [Euryarchaeota archaeon]